MNRRKFLKFLGFGAPAAAVVAVVAPKLLAQVPQGESYTEFQARLGEWHNYYSESSPDIAKAIKEYESSNFYFDRELVDRLKDDTPTTEMIKNWKSYSRHHTSTLPRTFFTYNVGKMS